MKIQRECPKCAGKLKYSPLYVDENEVWRTVTCEECGFCWDEVYTFDHNADVVTCAKLEF